MTLTLRSATRRIEATKVALDEGYVDKEDREHHSSLPVRSLDTAAVRPLRKLCHEVIYETPERNRLAIESGRSVFSSIVAVGIGLAHIGESQYKTEGLKKMTAAIQELLNQKWTTLTILWNPEPCLGFVQESSVTCQSPRSRFEILDLFIHIAVGYHNSVIQFVEEEGAERAFLSRESSVKTNVADAGQTVQSRRDSGNGAITSDSEGDMLEKVCPCDSTRKVQPTECISGLNVGDTACADDAGGKSCTNDAAKGNVAESDSAREWYDMNDIKGNDIEYDIKIEPESRDKSVQDKEMDICHDLDDIISLEFHSSGPPVSLDTTEVDYEFVTLIEEIVRLGQNAEGCEIRIKDWERPGTYHALKGGEIWLGEYW